MEVTSSGESACDHHTLDYHGPLYLEAPATTMRPAKPLPLEIMKSVLYLTLGQQSILREVMDMATSMFPYIPPDPMSKQTPSHYPWPKLVKHDVIAIRRRTDALQRLTCLTSQNPRPTLAKNLFRSRTLQMSLWFKVAAPLELRTKLSPSLREPEALHLTKQTNTDATIKSALQHDPSSCLRH